MKHCIITGGNSGIGRRAAYQIAGQGHTVILACRNLSAGTKTCEDIIKETNNENVFAMRVDLSLIADVKSFIAEYISAYGKLDVLINNAADFDISRKEPVITSEGNEAQFATNVIAPHLLALGFLDLIKTSTDGRIINISTQGLMLYPNLKLDFDNFLGDKYYKPSKTYYQNKLALLMLSLKLKDYLEDSDASVYAIRVTNVKLDITRYPDISPFLKKLYLIKSKFSVSPDDMARVYTELALEEKKTGFYYDEKSKEVPVNKYALVKKDQDKLWELLEQK